MFCTPRGLRVTNWVVDPVNEYKLFFITVYYRIVNAFEGVGD